MVYEVDASRFKTPAFTPKHAGPPATSQNLSRIIEADMAGCFKCFIDLRFFLTSVVRLWGHYCEKDLQSQV